MLGLHDFHADKIKKGFKHTIMVTVKLVDTNSYSQFSHVITSAEWFPFQTLFSVQGCVPMIDERTLSWFIHAIWESNQEYSEPVHDSKTDKTGQ